MQLPVTSDISVFFDGTSPPRHVITSLLMALQKVCTGQVVTRLSMTHMGLMNLLHQNWEHPLLTLEDIHYFTALNLTSINIDLDWIVDLKDSDLVEIASLCQRLEHLIINENHRWRAAGITPAGLAQFLQRCPSTLQLCIALDTRGYTSPPQIQTCGGSAPPNLITINVADSVIEAESVPALAASFADIFPLVAHGPFHFIYWSGWRMRCPDWGVYTKRWQDVCTLAQQKLPERSERSGESLTCTAS